MTLCEWCGYAVSDEKHYSSKDCNATGRGVVLHQRCALRVERLGRHLAPAVLAIVAEKGKHTP